MITGFNTDVKHEGHVYHVQTEDRGKENPVLESLVYIGGTIVAKKRTSYSDQLVKGAGEDTIAALLKRQHQVIIAAIKAGRIDDLISHTLKHSGEESRKRRTTGALAKPQMKPAASPPNQQKTSRPLPPPAPMGATRSTASQPRASDALKVNPSVTQKRSETGGLNLDSVIADYVKRSSGEGRIDVKVLTPDVFTAGKSVGLRVQALQDSKPVFDAIVTVKIIGTAFKPQVFIGRVGGDGVAGFSLALPAFTTGTAAIVIEAQSGRGRGELKKLIRRA